MTTAASTTSIRVEALGRSARQRDGLGCSSDKLGTDIEFERGGLTLYRKGVKQDGVSEVFTPASGRGALIGLSLSQGHSRRIFRGASSQAYGFASSSLYLRNFGDDYRAELNGPFDFLLLELSTAFLRETAVENGLRLGDGFIPFAGEDDPVLSNLMRAFAPTLERPQEASGLFVEQLSMAIGLHLLHAHGCAGAAPVTEKQPALARWQEQRAKDLMEARLSSDVSIAEIAEGCSLSRGYFIRAFRAATGLTPHRWLMQRRVEEARRMIEGSDYSLADIAVACGFSDQSHLTRHFTHILGVSPGRLRRLR
ncbi:AraC family transcriptional regulator [Rhizobium sp. FKL33]|uniref:AraC family transcriptional regulator n=1 Tax=Rhizobium sp. FKL33 TaxID=2562307 RepID=UPI0010BFC5B0|nr:AraC family transcriptional regulator [Rhizobium sp. FKL33]